MWNCLRLTVAGAAMLLAACTTTSDTRPGDPAATPPDEQPVACIMIHAPVCGLDGETYSNECLANAAGAGVACEGECPCDGPGQGGDSP